MHDPWHGITPDSCLGPILHTQHGGYLELRQSAQQRPLAEVEPRRRSVDDRFPIPERVS